MLKDANRLLLDARLVRAAHWTVFGLGAASLLFAVAATAVSYA